MKKVIIFTLITLIITGGLFTVYMYLENRNASDYSSGTFVDRGEDYGYAKMYNLCESL